jgi:hypothetical protein
VLIPASLLAIALGAPAIGALSPTVDECSYIQYGVKHWFGGSSQFLIDLGVQPLPFWVQGIPSALYFQWKYGGLPGGPGINFGADLTRADQLLVLHWARWVNLLIAAPLTIGSVYLLTRRWFGATAAAAAALFCAVEPSFLANYAHGTGDAIVVPCAVLAMLAYDDYLRGLGAGRLVLVAGLFGLGLAIKILMIHNGLLLLGACFLTWLAGRVRAVPTTAGRLRLIARESARFLAIDLAVIIGVSLPMCWALHGFLMGPLLGIEGENKVAYKVLNILGYSTEEARGHVAAMQALRVPEPITAARAVWAHSQGGHPMSFHGKAATSGPWYYYPYVIAMKTHLVLLGVALIGLLRPAAWRSPVAWGTVLFLAFLCTPKSHMGPRHYLVLLALLSALGGLGVATILGALRSRALQVAAASVLAVASLALTLRSLPDYFVHTSPLWGGDLAGYKYADANYDWGQGLYLAFQAADRAGLRPVCFLHSGAPRYGVPEDRDVIPEREDAQILERMRGRYVAIAVTLLFHSPTLYSRQAALYRALAQLGPDGRLTPTFFYFDLRDPARFAALERLWGREQEVQRRILREGKIPSWALSR